MSSNRVKEWFSSAPEDKRALLLTLRDLILKQDNRIVEEVKWSRPCYSINGKLFCYLYLTKNHVTLGFQKGTSLKDPDRMLTGTGKEMRHINFLTLSDLEQPGIQQLIEEAVNL